MPKDAIQPLATDVSILLVQVTLSFIFVFHNRTDERVVFHLGCAADNFRSMKSKQSTCLTVKFNQKAGLHSAPCTYIEPVLVVIHTKLIGQALFAALPVAAAYHNRPPTANAGMGHEQTTGPTCSGCSVAGSIIFQTMIRATICVLVHLRMYQAHNIVFRFQACLLIFILRETQFSLCVLTVCHVLFA